MKQQILKGFNEYLQSIGDQVDYETVIDMEVMLAQLLTYKKRLYNQMRGFSSYAVDEYLGRSRQRRSCEYQF